jgi:hypothetical protein
VLIRLFISVCNTISIPLFILAYDRS